MVVKMGQEDVKAFVEWMVLERYKVIGTKRRGSKYVFDMIERAEDFTTDYVPTILPLKKFLMPLVRSCSSMTRRAFL